MPKFNTPITAYSGSSQSMEDSEIIIIELSMEDVQLLVHILKDANPDMYDTTELSKKLLVWL